MGFLRQEYWSGLPFPSSGDLPDPEIEHRSPALEVDSLPSELPRKPSGLPGKLDDIVNSIFTFKRKHHTIFHSGCTNLHSHQQCEKSYLVFTPSIIREVFIKENCYLNEEQLASLELEMRGMRLFRERKSLFKRKRRLVQRKTNGRKNSKRAKNRSRKHARN